MARYSVGVDFGTLSGRALLVNVETGEETVKTHVSRIRNRLKNIEEIKIVTLKGLGYKADIEKGGK